MHVEVVHKEEQGPLVLAGREPAQHGVRDVGAASHRLGDVVFAAVEGELFVDLLKPLGEVGVTRQRDGPDECRRLESLLGEDLGEHSVLVVDDVVVAGGSVVVRVGAREHGRVGG